MRPITLDELVAHAQANFPEDFALLPPASSYTIKGERDVLIGKGEWYSDIFGPRDIYFNPDPSGGFFVIYGYQETRDARRTCPQRLTLIEPFCWIEKSYSLDDSLPRVKAFIHYCLAAIVREPIHSPLHDFLAVFQRACRDISKAKGCEDRDQDGDSENETSSLDIETSDDTYKQTLEDFTKSITQELVAKAEAFEQSSKSEHQRLQTRVAHLKTELYILKRQKKQLQRTSREVSDQAKAATEEASEWKKKFEELQNKLQALVGDIAN